MADQVVNCFLVSFVSIILTVASSTSCQSPLDCPHHQRCSQGTCKTPKRGDYCDTSLDCPFEQRCEWGSCVDFFAMPIEFKIFLAIFASLFALAVAIIIYRLWRGRRAMNAFTSQRTSFVINTSHAIPVSSGPLVPQSTSNWASGPAYEAPPSYNEATGIATRHEEPDQRTSNPDDNK